MLSWIRCWSKTLPCSGRVHWQLRVGPCFFLLLSFSYPGTNHPLLPIFKLCFLSHKVSRQSTGNIHHRPRSPTRDAHLPHCWLHLDTSQCPVRGWDQIKIFLVFFSHKINYNWIYLRVLLRRGQPIQEALTSSWSSSSDLSLPWCSPSSKTSFCFAYFPFALASFPAALFSQYCTIFIFFGPKQTEHNAKLIWM